MAGLASDPGAVQELAFGAQPGAPEQHQPPLPAAALDARSRFLLSSQFAYPHESEDASKVSAPRQCVLRLLDPQEEADASATRPRQWRWYVAYNHGDALFFRELDAFEEDHDAEPLMTTHFNAHACCHAAHPGAATLDDVALLAGFETGALSLYSPVADSEVQDASFNRAGLGSRSRVVGLAWLAEAEMAAAVAATATLEARLRALPQPAAESSESETSEEEEEDEEEDEEDEEEEDDSPGKRRPPSRRRGANETAELKSPSPSRSPARPAPSPSPVAGRRRPAAAASPKPRTRHEEKSSSRTDAKQQQQQRQQQQPQQQLPPPPPPPPPPPRTLPATLRGAPFFLAAHANGLLLVYDARLSAERRVDTRRLRRAPAALPAVHLHAGLARDANPLLCLSVTVDAVTPLRLRDARVSHDGAALALVGRDGHVAVLDVATLKLVAVFRSFFGAFLFAEWSPDDRVLVIGGEDDSVFVVDPFRRAFLAHGEGHASWVTAAAFYAARRGRGAAGAEEAAYDVFTIGEDCQLLLWSFRLPVDELFDAAARRRFVEALPTDLPVIAPPNPRALQQLAPLARNHPHLQPLTAVSASASWLASHESYVRRAVARAQQQQQQPVEKPEGTAAALEEMRLALEQAEVRAPRDALLVTSSSANVTRVWRLVGEADAPEREGAGGGGDEGGGEG